ncbi:SGNH/GDSL hydrolase family protein [Bacillus sp. 2205SS5-2]|uniref:SGNH/GDSL hydrolase family protein n=1 Tax=Bacillus sp. 2205SS5-2 TaxID=3109031 RepID=UPI0030077D1D
MKGFLMGLMTITCLAILVSGNIYWKQQTTITDAKSEDRQVENKEKSDKVRIITNDNFDVYLNLTGGWPAQAKATYEEALLEGTPFSIAIIGSDAMNSVENGWDQLVTKKIEENFDDTITTYSLPYNNTTTSFVEDSVYEEAIEQKPDLIIFEPFTLNDNGLVLIEDSLLIIENIQTAFSKENPDTVFILMPPQPLYMPNGYQNQVNALAEYVEENEIPYINHWENWPATDDILIKDYLDEESNPNDKGHKAWASAITDLLIQ